MRSTRREKKSGPGGAAAGIKIGNTWFYSGVASSYRTIDKAETAYFKMLNEQGG